MADFNGRMGIGRLLAGFGSMKFILLLIMACFLGGCATAEVQGRIAGTGSLEQLQDCGRDNACCASNGISTIRTTALQETALSLGAQGGLACRARQVNCLLTQNSKSLDRIFNFNLMMLPHNIVPPVLEEGRSILNLDDCQTIRIADRIYKIIKQACFVTTAPNWREYLWLDYPVPDVPYGTMLPKNKCECEIWKCYTAIGWQKGMEQANAIYAANLARLKRDFNGMVLYRTLLTEHMISPPYVARTELGITGDCSNLRINDQVLRITAQPCLQTNSKCWRPIVDDP